MYLIKINGNKNLDMVTLLALICAGLFLLEILLITYRQWETPVIVKKCPQT